jgi:hypothetical protein
LSKDIFFFVMAQLVFFSLAPNFLTSKSPSSAVNVDNNHTVA